MAVCHTAAGLLSSLVRVDVKCSYTYILQEKLYELEAAKKMSTRPHLLCSIVSVAASDTRPAPGQRSLQTSTCILLPPHYRCTSTLNTTHYTL